MNSNIIQVQTVQGPMRMDHLEVGDMVNLLRSFCVEVGLPFRCWCQPVGDQ